MLRLRNSHFLSSLVIGGFGFLLLSGCAQTFTGNLSELVSEPARQKDFVENQPFTERDDVKIDPLAFETTTTTSPDPIIQYHAESNPVEEDIELTSLPELATTPEFEPVQYPEQTITAYSDIHEKPSMPEVEHTDVPPPSVIQLLPMSPAPKTSEPIALLLPQSSPLTQQPMPTPTEATQLVEPQMIEPPTTELPTLTATAQYGELDDSVVIELPEVALTPATTTMIWPSDDAPNFNASEGTASAMSIPDASEVLTGAQLLPSFQSTNQFQLSEPSAPGGLESEQSDSESTAAVENTIDFVSDQMQVMVPPFADPPAEECDSCPTTNPASQSDSNNQFVGFDQDFEQANELESPNTSDFIESLIASSMDPTAIETLASATESTPPDTSEAVVETPVGWNEQLAKTIEIFEAEASSANADQRHRLEQSLRILQSLKTSMQDSPTQLDSAESNDLKQYWEHQLNALNAIMSNSVDEDQFGAAATEALKHLRIAASRLRNSADLVLKSSCFCRKVVGFGQYETFPESEFTSNQQVLVYCELENFTPMQQTASGVTNFQTKISSSFWITNEKGDMVQTTDYPVVTDNARNIRNDFFMHLPIRFGDLPAGSYELQVEVRDFGSGKTAQLSQPMKFLIR